MSYQAHKICLIFFLICNFFLNLSSNFALINSVLLNQGCHFTWNPGNTWKNLEFDYLDKKKPGKIWNLGNFEKYLEKPGILNKKLSKTWNF